LDIYTFGHLKNKLYNFLLSKKTKERGNKISNILFEEKYDEEMS